MENENINFIFSLVLVILGLQFTGYLIYIRIKRTVFEEKYKKDTSKYRVLQKLLKPSKLVIVATLTLICVINLGFSVHTVLHHSSSRSILVSGPIACILLYTTLLWISYKLLGEGAKFRTRIHQ